MSEKDSIISEYELTENFEQNQNDFDLPVIQTVTFGNGREYYVSRNGVPYLKAEVNEVSDFFDKACIFGKYLCIGSGSTVIFVNLESFASLTMEVSKYFGYFFIHEDILYIAFGTGIMALDEKLQVLWKNERLADDGVIIHEVFQLRNALRISAQESLMHGEYWKEKLVSLKTGEQVI
ncbi:MAG: hypothetical protein IJ642_02625 [Oscillospiraceae bacterium]|nr:hypothetical protein [Oscillospiraceae bacterium]